MSADSLGVEISRCRDALGRTVCSAVVRGALAMSTITQAFVPSAGLGTRLRPLTDEIPKPLIPIFQKPLITFALDHLIAAGVRKVVINMHRFPEMFRAFFAGNSYAGCSVALIYEPELLETGGGIKNAQLSLGDGAFITYSGDILTDIDLRPLIEEHFARGNDVTLALRATGLGSDMAFRGNRVVDIAKRYGIPGTLDFANIAVWSSEIFRRIPPGLKISFIPILSDWIGDGGKVGGLILNGGKWFNIGSRGEYLEVHRVILRECWRPYYIRNGRWPESVAQTARVHPSAQLRGCTVVGADCEVGADAVLEDTILWPGAQIASKSRLRSCIVRSQKTVSGIYSNTDI